jgi:2-keto-4-pentenoate hydratase/2-oxohepta-3-ene-1,7-dioic acid hydratase in catechol pathway
MRLATVEHAGTPLAAVVDGDRVYPLPGANTTIEAIGLGRECLLGLGLRALADTAGSLPLASVRLRPPLQPATIRDFVAFEEHVEGIVRTVAEDAVVVPEWYAAPTFYFTNPYAVVGAHDDVAVPPGCALLDFELEVAAVIGQEGGDLSPEQARDHIVGYTILNDWSARDLQRQEMRVGLGPAKAKDFATTLGPWLVTADELEPFRDADGFLRLRMTVEVNGIEIGRDLLSNMGWTFDELVAYASRGTVVRPGDVLGSGTCGNGGCLAELWGRRGNQSPPPLRPGDVVTMTVQGIGSISNRIVAGRSPVPIPAARRRARDRG